MKEDNEEKGLVAQETSAVTVKKQLEVVNSSPAALMQMATANGWDLNDFEKILKLQKEFDAGEAKKSYDQDMAKFKKKAPEITKDSNVNYTKKDGTVVDYNHPSVGQVCEKVNLGLAEFGFSADYETEQPEGWVVVTCVITHKKGHSKRTTLKSKPDSSGGKNEIQAISSAVTYLQRYTLLLRVGLAPKNIKDDDGRGAGKAPDKTVYITSKHKSNILDMLAAADTEELSLLKTLPGNIDSIDNMPLDLYDTAISMLQLKKAANNANNS